MPSFFPSIFILFGEGPRKWDHRHFIVILGIVGQYNVLPSK